MNPDEPLLGRHCCLKKLDLPLKDVQLNVVRLAPAVIFFGMGPHDVALAEGQVLEILKPPVQPAILMICHKIARISAREPNTRTGLHQSSPLSVIVWMSSLSPETFRRVVMPQHGSVINARDTKVSVKLCTQHSC